MSYLPRTALLAVIAFAVPTAAFAQPPCVAEEVRSLVEQSEASPNSPNCAEMLPAYERAYACEPHSQLLYRIGICAGEGGDYVRAVRALKHYLDSGGSAMSEARRTDVDAHLAQLEPRIARVTVSSNIGGLEIRVDGNCAIDETTYDENCTSTATERVLLVNPGERRLTVKHAGFRDVAHVLKMDPGERTRVRLNTTTRDDGQENPFRDSMWTAWGLTGGGAVATTILGVKTALGEQGIGSSTGVATIALGVGTLVAAGFATYFTIRSSHWKPRTNGARAADVFGLPARF